MNSQLAVLCFVLPSLSLGNNLVFYPYGLQMCRQRAHGDNGTYVKRYDPKHLYCVITKPEKKTQMYEWDFPHGINDTSYIIASKCAQFDQNMSVRIYNFPNTSQGRKDLSYNRIKAIAFIPKTQYFAIGADDVGTIFQHSWKSDDNKTIMGYFAHDFALDRGNMFVFLVARCSNCRYRCYICRTSTTGTYFNALVKCNVKCNRLEVDDMNEKIYVGCTSFIESVNFHGRGKKRYKRLNFKFSGFPVNHLTQTPFLKQNGEIFRVQFRMKGGTVEKLGSVAKFSSNINTFLCLDDYIIVTFDSHRQIGVYQISTNTTQYYLSGLSCGANVMIFPMIL